MRHYPEAVEEQSLENTALENSVSGEVQVEGLENLQTEKETAQEEQQKQKEELEKEFTEQEKSPQVLEEDDEPVIEKENKSKKKQSRWGKMKKFFSLKWSWRWGNKRIASTSWKSDSWR